MARERRYRLAVYLLKDGTSVADALSEPDNLEHHPVTGLGSSDALVVKGSPSRVPAWASWLDGHVTGSLLGLRTASAGAALLVTAGRRLFAVTFGQGRHLLDHELVVPDFGLRVVLNTVAADQLKSVDVRTIDETTMHTRRDLSRDSSLSAFGLDMSRDLLSAVTGRPRDQTLASRLTGADSLILHAETSVPELPALLTRLLAAYTATDYRENFEFIDHLAAERNPAQLARLDQKLVSDLGTRAITDAHLAAPETLDWQELAGFRFSFGGRNATVSQDPSIGSYLDARVGRPIDIKLLKTDKLIALRASAVEVMAQWSIYRCLVYQVELGGALYVLSSGQWFRVALEYRKHLEQRVRGLPTRTGLPPADAGTSEAAYNAKAARALDAALMDQQLVRFGPDPVEVCDILTREGNFIHVKHRGSSSTLSHLFTQGVNSAELLLLESEFRKRARAVAKGVDRRFARVIPLARPTAGDFEITFAVITRSRRPTPLTLPFFSVVSLDRNATHLQNYGFKVSVAAIRET